MMWRAMNICLVLVVCVVATTIAFGQKFCTTVDYGLLKGQEIHVNDQRMLPHVAEWIVTIPQVCPKVLGVSLTACDDVGAPIVYFTSEKNGVVKRVGDVNFGAYVYITVFCDPEPERFQLLGLLLR